MKIIRPALQLATVGAASFFNMSRRDDPPCGCYSRDVCRCDSECSCDYSYCSKDD